MITEIMLALCDNSNVVHGVDTCFGCTESFTKDQAKFSLTNAPGPHLVIDIDTIDCLRQKRRCDYLFVADDAQLNVNWVVPIEMTSSRRKDPKVVIEQLQKTAQVIEKNIDRSVKVRLQPVLAGSVNEVRMRGKNSSLAIKFRGEDIPVAIIRSGDSIGSVLKR